MTCERYWSEGVVLADRGEPDPHRDTCIDCSREHRARDELIRAMAMVGGPGYGDPAWEARVWSEIARLERPPTARRWYLGAALALGLAALVIMLGRGDPTGDAALQIDVVRREGGAVRSMSPAVGDRIRVTLEVTEEVRVYRARRLVLRCPVGVVSQGCASDARRKVAELVLTTPGDYQVVAITSPTAELMGELGLDLRAVVRAGGHYRMTELSAQ